MIFFPKKGGNIQKEENRPMGYISIHYSIEEYKSDDGEESGVGFLIACDPIGVNNLLECDCEVICAKITWWLLCVLSFSIYLSYGIDGLALASSWSYSSTFSSSATLIHSSPLNTDP